MPASPLSLDVIRVMLWVAARVLFRIRYHGAAHVPRTGPVLLTPNHVSYMDPALVSIPIRRPLHYMTLEEFFPLPLLGPVIRWLRAFPVDNTESDSRAMRHALRILRAGQPLVIFPEGRRSLDGELGRFAPGIFRLALVSDVPVVPVTIAGAFEAWSLHRRLPRPRRVTVTYHAPLTRADLPPGDRKTQAETMATLVRERIATALPPGLDAGRAPSSPAPIPPPDPG